MLVRPCLLAGLLCLASLGSALSAQTAPACTQLRDVYAIAPTPLAGGAFTVLDLCISIPRTGPGPFPCIIWLPGGAWRAANLGTFQLPAFASQGYVVVEARYRTSGQAPWPAQLHDVKAAIRHVRSQSAQWSIDPTRIAVGGLSAGAHIAAMVASTNGQPRAASGPTSIDVEGLVGFFPNASSFVCAGYGMFPVTDMRTLEEVPLNAVAEWYLDATGQPGAANAVLGGLPLSQPWLTRLASPINFYGPGDAPIALAHGEEDGIVGISQSAALHAWSFTSGGEPIRLRTVNGANHDFARVDPMADLAWLDRNVKNLPTTLVGISSYGPDLVEGGTSASGLRITLSAPLPGDLPLRLGHLGTATDGIDIAPLGNVIVVPAGSTSFDLPLLALSDALIEARETVRVVLQPSPDIRIDPNASVASLGLVDVPASPGVPRIDVTALTTSSTEGSGASLDFELRADLTLSAPLVIGLRWGGEALAGTDLGPLPATATLPAGSSAVTVSIPVIDDNIRELPEVLTLQLKAGADYRLGTSTQTGAVIEDDDTLSGVPLVSIYALQGSFDETSTSSVQVHVARRGNAANALTVDLGVSGTTSPGVDHSPVPLQVNFSAGQELQILQLSAIDDLAAEGEEQLELRLLPGAGYSISDYSAATITLQDDEAPTPRDPAGGPWFEASATERDRPSVLTLAGADANTTIFFGVGFSASTFDLGATASGAVGLLGFDPLTAIVVPLNAGNDGRSELVLAVPSFLLPVEVHAQGLAFRNGVLTASGLSTRSLRSSRSRL